MTVTETAIVDTVFPLDGTEINFRPVLADDSPTYFDMDDAAHELIDNRHLDPENWRADGGQANNTAIDEADLYSRRSFHA
jgi:hypothetical protein